MIFYLYHKRFNIAGSSAVILKIDKIYDVCVFLSRHRALLGDIYTVDAYNLLTSLSTLQGWIHSTLTIVFVLIFYSSLVLLGNSTVGCRCNFCERSESIHKSLFLGLFSAAVMVYNYTKPRGPVAAMYNSPGPCYGLPTLVGHEKHDPRSVHTKGPAYPFGMRTKKDGDSCGPGPCHYPDKVYRSGKDGTPRYSMAFRQQELRGLQTPGPGAYSVGNEKPTSVSYSFGRRHHDPSADNTPGIHEIYKIFKS